MRVLVCIKVVSGNLVTQNTSESSSLTINPYDLYSLKESVENKKKYGWHIICLCMGSMATKEILKRCFAIGADEVVLLSDFNFVGSDSYATSYILSKAVKKLNCELVICGHEAIDGETGQVPSGLAAFLNRVCIYNVLECSELGEGRILLQYREEDKIYTVEVQTPVIISYFDYCREVSVSLLALKRAKNKEITIWDSKMLELDPSNCGQIGSKTKVLRSTKNKINKTRETQFVDGTVADKCDFLVNLFSNY